MFESLWECVKNNLFLMYEEDGYYFEDVVWIFQYFDDVNLLFKDVWNSILVGMYVKLLFWFVYEYVEWQNNEIE